MTHIFTGHRHRSQIAGIDGIGPVLIFDGHIDTLEIRSRDDKRHIAFALPTVPAHRQLQGNIFTVFHCFRNIDSECIADIGSGIRGQRAACAGWIGNGDTSRERTQSCRNVRGRRHTDILNGEVHIRRGASHQRSVAGRCQLGGHHIRTIGHDNVDTLEILDIILCTHGQLIRADQQRIERQRDVAICIGESCRHHIILIRKGHVCVCRGLHGQRAGSNHQNVLTGDGHRGGDAQIGTDRCITENMINFPIIALFARRGGLHGRIAGHDNASQRRHPFVVVFTMRMEHPVVCAQIGCIIRDVCRDVAAHTHCPIEIFVPKAVVGSADVGHSPLVGRSQERLPEAGGLIELATDTTVADHHTIFALIRHGRYLRIDELRLIPAILRPMSRVVRPAHASTDFASDGGRLAVAGVQMRISRRIIMRG